MNNSDVFLTFNNRGICDYCNDFDKRILPWWNYGKGHEEELSSLIKSIKDSGKGKNYDCLLGLSGGVDSSFLLHLAIKEWKLHPYVLHIDTGWDSPETIDNLNKICSELKVHVHVEKVDEADLREMQIAFFKAGFACLDAPQDHAFIAIIDQIARKKGIKYILNGYNIATEVISDPSSWSIGGGPTADKGYIKDVLRKNGNVLPKNFVWTTGFQHKVLMPYYYKIKTVTPLNLLPISRQLMLSTLSNEYGFHFYGQKHFENELTKFIGGYWNVKRFGYDIRLAWLSSLILTGEITREEALAELESPPLSEEEGQRLFNVVSQKLEISAEELQHYFEMPFIPMKYKSHNLSFKIGIRIFQLFKKDYRIRR